MVKTLDELKAQKEALFRKNPGLRNMDVMTLKQAGVSVKELSQFIETCFDHDYQNKIRMRFTPEFLKNNAKDFIGKVIRNDGKIVATILAFPRQWSQINKDGNSNFVIVSGLSVHPDFRSQRLGQLLAVEIKESLIADGYDFLVSWFDARHSKPWHSLRIFGKKKEQIRENSEINLLCKSYSLERLKRYEDIGMILNFLIRGIHFLYPLKQGEILDYRVIDQLDEMFLDRYQRFIETNDRHLHSYSLFAPELIKRLYGSQNRGTFFYTLENKNSEIEAMAFGFKSPQPKGDYLAYFDGLILPDSLPKSVKRKFMGHIEADLRDTHGCMAGTIPANCIRGAFSYGYIPYEKQVLGFDPYTELDFGIRDAAGMMIGLR